VVLAEAPEVVSLAPNPPSFLLSSSRPGFCARTHHHPPTPSCPPHTDLVRSRCYCTGPHFSFSEKALYPSSAYGLSTAWYVCAVLLCERCACVPAHHKAVGCVAVLAGTSVARVCRSGPPPPKPHSVSTRRLHLLWLWLWLLLLLLPLPPLPVCIQRRHRVSLPLSSPARSQVLGLLPSGKATLSHLPLSVCVSEYQSVTDRPTDRPTDRLPSVSVCLQLSNIQPTHPPPKRLRVNVVHATSHCLHHPTAAPRLI
jgi:hypothetical protein